MVLAVTHGTNNYRGLTFMALVIAHDADGHIGLTFMALLVEYAHRRLTFMVLVVAHGTDGHIAVLTGHCMSVACHSVDHRTVRGNAEMHSILLLKNSQWQPLQYSR